jgi:hypothetical protein
MSSEEATTPPLYDMTIGTAGTFTQDAKVDVAAQHSFR